VYGIKHIGFETNAALIFWTYWTSLMLCSLHAQESKKKYYKSIPAGELVSRKSISINEDMTS
jgi:hypothetical protein